MAKKNIAYKLAIAEIELIVKKIESDEADVDELAGNVKRVAELIKICKEKLYKAEKEVKEIIDNI
jgi:exodeoxyribonuclease VII small subunit